MFEGNIPFWYRMVVIIYEFLMLPKLFVCNVYCTTGSTTFQLNTKKEKNIATRNISEFNIGKISWRSSVLLKWFMKRFAEHVFHFVYTYKRILTKFLSHFSTMYNSVTSVYLKYQYFMKESNLCSGLIMLVTTQKVFIKQVQEVMYL